MTDEEWEARLEGCYADVLRGLMAASGSRELAEDALQDALVAALRPGVRDAIERVDAWLYVVGLRALRRGRWRRRFERTLGAVTVSTPAPGLDRVIAIELLRRLSDRQREMVVARYWLGLSYVEMAAQFGVSVGTATSTVAQALARLRRDTDREEGRAWMTGI